MANTSTTVNGVTCTLGSSCTVTNAVGGSVKATAQTANSAALTVYSVPAGGAGLYNISCYTQLTTAATSSTLPKCYGYWTIGGVAKSATLQQSQTTNTVGDNGVSGGSGATSMLQVYVDASTNITCATSGYVSSPGATMAYSVFCSAYLVAQP